MTRRISPFREAGVNAVNRKLRHPLQPCHPGRYHGCLPILIPPRMDGQPHRIPHTIELMLPILPILPGEEAFGRPLFA